MSFERHVPDAVEVETPPVTITVGKAKRTPSQQAKMARAKGANGEREIVNALRDVMATIEAELTLTGKIVKCHSEELKRNSLQSRGGGHDLHGVPMLSVEVKRGETLNVEVAWQQCLRQAVNQELPVLVYRKNKAKWTVRTYGALYDQWGRVVENVVVTVAFDDFLSYYAKLYRGYLGG